MEATCKYPNWPPVLSDHGFGGSVAITNPDDIHFLPSLKNASRCKFTICFDDVMKPCYRNWEGYPFLRAYNKLMWAPSRALARPGVDANAQLNYFNSNYKNLIPSDLLKSYLHDDVKFGRTSEAVFEIEGNIIESIAGRNGEKIVFCPSGQVLQQLHAWNSLTSGQIHSSNKLETGNTIRQIQIMGKPLIQWKENPYQKMMVGVRGVGNFSIVSVTFNQFNQKNLLQLAEKVSVKSMLQHVACSPHVQAEAILLTSDSELFLWTAEKGLAPLEVTSNKLLKCEYSSHPCVLWSTNRHAVYSYDLRDRSHTNSPLFDYSVNGLPSTTNIYDIKRMNHSPFLFTLASNTSIDIIDSRIKRTALFSWANPAAEIISSCYLDTQCVKSKGIEQGFIISTYPSLKKSILLPFQEASIEGKVFQLAPIRNIDQEIDSEEASISHIVSAESNLAIDLIDGVEDTKLLGASSIVRDNQKVDLFHLNSHGDLYMQTIVYQDLEELNTTQLQSNLPCGTPALTKDRHRKISLPVPTKAIIPEYDKNSMAKFVNIPVKNFFESFMASCASELEINMPSMEKNALILDHQHSIIQACQPPVTLFNLHRYLLDDLNVQMQIGELLRILEMHPQFHVRNIQLRPRPPYLQTISFMDEKGNMPINALDNRFNDCKCTVYRARTPCDSLACIIGHSIIVSVSSDSIIRKRRKCYRNRSSSLGSRSTNLYDQLREAYGTINE